jgi:hypothetical protein
MTKLYTVNRRIACSPFETTSVVLKAEKSMPIIHQKKSVTELTVACDTIEGDYFKGDVVVVRGDAVQHGWAKEVVELRGEKVIFVPSEQVVAVIRVPPHTYFESKASEV